MKCLLCGHELEEAIVLIDDAVENINNGNLQDAIDSANAAKNEIVRLMVIITKEINDESNSGIV